MIKQYLKVIRDCSQRTGNKKILGLGGGEGFGKKLNLWTQKQSSNQLAYLKKGNRWKKPFIIVRENMILLNSKAVFIYGQLPVWTLSSESLV